MKMIVSDYDNTFYSSEEGVKNNIIAVKEFQKNNIFIIATGRSYFHFKLVKDLYNIPYNYLIINHGATILKDDKIVYNLTISNKIKNEIIEILKEKNIINSFSCNGKASNLLIENDNLTKIHVTYESIMDAKVIKEKIDERYNDYVNVFYVSRDKGIEIVDKLADKSNAIKNIANLEGILRGDIYTIGDSYNDIEMIKKFNGYSLVNSIDEIKNNSLREYENVSNFIYDVINSNI